MSPTVGPFERLEEFPSFSSCISCFGRPIISPLLTPSRRHELQQLRASAVNKEAELLRRRRRGHLQKTDSQISSKIKTSNSDFQSNVQDSSALWYPSSKDYHKGVSVAISKFPTCGIYSSVHTGAIVCSDVIENSHQYAPRIANDSLFSSRASTVHCVECSHSNINLDCSLCRAEYDQNFHNTSFASDISPEVPCRTFSLLQPNVNVLNDELNSTVEENECDSLPTVICNQKYVVPDTDSESNATCMTQSTDLEKYMELSCEFGSPDNSAAAWDSKSISQQYTLSRSDDASSETIVNTENELTPCASTMAEFTDNIEDELSNTDETTNISENKAISVPVTLKRAHSVDSYMKIIQSCARNMHVKKSSSEPFNTNLKTSSAVQDEIKASSSSQTSHLIKEDSKESEDSNEMPEKDNSVSNTVESSANNEEILVSNADENNSFHKKHIRQNSYTLDHPSSALILAHADCTCNFDANCISPHCSALTDQNELALNSAFTREKVTDIPMSLHQGKKLPLLTSETISSKEGLTSSVVDVFPLVKEDSVEKSNSGNANVIEEEQMHETAYSAEGNTDLKSEEEEQLNEKFSENLNTFDDSTNQEYLKRIYKELQESHEMRVRELFEEQNRQWLKLQEEFKEQERCLYEKLKLPNVSSSDISSKVEKTIKIEIHDCPDREITSEVSSNHEEDKVFSVNTSTTFSEQICTSDSNLLLQSHNLKVSSDSSEFLRSPSKINSYSENPRALLTPSSESKTPNNSPSTLLGNIRQTQQSKESESSIECNYDYNEDHLYFSTAETQQNINGFSSQNAFLLPHISDIPKSPNTDLSSDTKLDTSSTCFCDKSPEQCRCCASYNGFDEYDVNHSHFEYVSVPIKKRCSPHVIDLNSQVEKTFPENSSSHCNFKYKNLNSEDDHFAFSNKMRLKNTSSEKANDSMCVRETKLVTSQDNVEMADMLNNKSSKVSQQSVKGKSKLSLDTIVSSPYAKTLRNGSISTFSTSSNKSIIIDPAILKRFEKLPAFVKGYLTRRLFKTERVQNLIKTLQDTALLIGKLSEDLSLKGDSVSERDVDFHRQLIVQLMTTFHSVYDIFCTISTKERMNIISESRNHKLRQRILEQKKASDVPVTSNAPVPDTSKKSKLSSATLKALERKRRSAIDSRTFTIEDFKSFRARSVIENRTYTIEDFKNRPGRSRSCMLSKSHSVSPSAIYKVSVGLSPKRKTASSKTPGSRRCLYKNWVP